MTQLNSFGLGLFATLALLRPIDAAPQSEGLGRRRAERYGRTLEWTHDHKHGAQCAVHRNRVLRPSASVLDHCLRQGLSLFGGGCRTTATTVSCGQQSRNPPQT